MKTLDGALADLLCMVQQHGVPDPGLSHTDIATRELPSHPHGWDFGQLELEDPRDAAVLILFGSLDDRPAAYRDTLVPEELDVLLTQRALTLRKHPGQISFPGGARDLEDTSDTQCALREAQEETGLDPADVQPLGVLPSVPLSVSGFQVTPVVAWWTEPSRVAVVDAGEATRVFRVPVGDLVNPANRVLSAKNTGTGHRFTAPAFHVADTLVWGFTAIILDRILELTGWSEPWDHERVIDVSNWNAAQPVPAVTHLSQLPSSPTTVT